MAGELLTLPMRLGVRFAQTFVRAGLSVSTQAFALLNELRYTRGSENGDTRAPQTPAWSPSPEPAPRRVPIRREPVSAVAAPEDQPVHVSEEPVLVAERADPGAEDGAGANVVIDEPWRGFDQLTAKEVIARLRDADSAKLAAVELYERGKRRRKTVLQAVSRQLASKNGTP